MATDDAIEISMRCVTCIAVKRYWRSYRTATVPFWPIELWDDISKGRVGAAGPRKGTFPSLGFSRFDELSSASYAEPMGAKARIWAWSVDDDEHSALPGHRPANAGRRYQPGDRPKISELCHCGKPLSSGVLQEPAGMLQPAQLNACCQVHSHRSAITGSTAVARRAGM